jgi:hypothetical protein
MIRKLFVLLSAAAGMSAPIAHADTPQPHPLAPDHGSAIGASKAAGKAFVRTMPSPTTNETSVTRMPDGRLVVSCAQVPNPKAVVNPPNRNAKKPAAGISQ